MQLQLQYTNYTTLQLQLQLHYTTLHPAVVGEVTDQVTTATIVTTPKRHNSNHLSVHQCSGFALTSVIHNNQALLEVFYSETSTTALCCTI